MNALQYGHYEGDPLRYRRLQRSGTYQFHTGNFHVGITETDAMYTFWFYKYACRLGARCWHYLQTATAYRSLSVDVNSTVVGIIYLYIIMKTNIYEKKIPRNDFRGWMNPLVHFRLYVFQFIENPRFRRKGKNDMMSVTIRILFFHPSSLSLLFFVSF